VGRAKNGESLIIRGLKMGGRSVRLPVILIASQLRAH
jgi:hypothetical protein